MYYSSTLSLGQSVQAFDGRKEREEPFRSQIATWLMMTVVGAFEKKGSAKAVYTRRKSYHWKGRVIHQFHIHFWGVFPVFFPPCFHPSITDDHHSWALWDEVKVEEKYYYTQEPSVPFAINHFHSYSTIVRKAQWWVGEKENWRKILFTFSRSQTAKCKSIKRDKKVRDSQLVSEGEGKKKVALNYLLPQPSGNTNTTYSRERTTTTTITPQKSVTSTQVSFLDQEVGGKKKMMVVDTRSSHWCPCYSSDKVSIYFFLCHVVQ